MLKTVSFMGLVLFALSLLTANVQAGSVHNQTYICERGVALQVVFIKDKDISYAVVAIDGKLVPMRQDRGTSGELFIAVDDQDSYRLQIKGNDAVLTYKDSGQSKGDKVILSACQADIEED